MNLTSLFFNGLRSIPLAGTALMALGVPVSAQQAADPVNVGISACAVALNGDLSEVHLPLAKAAGNRQAAWLKVSLNVFTVGPPVAYKGPAALRFFDSPSEEAKQVAAATVAGTAKSILLLFLPEPGAGGYKVIQVDDADFAFGSYYFQNLSSHTVVIDLAGQKQILKPGAKAVLAARAGENQNVKIHASINGAARLIKSTSWRIDADQRELVFFYTPPGVETVLTKHLVSSKALTPPGT